MRWVAVAAAVGSVLLTAPSSAQVPAGKTRHYTYGPSTGAYVFAEEVVAAQETAAGRAAVLGYFSFTTTRSTFTLRLDDVGALDGQEVPVSFHVDGRWLQRCVPVRTTTSWPAPAGHLVKVWPGMADADPLACSGAAAGGTADVGL